MLKLLLVDDEQPILDGLKVLIEWERYGISLEFANNGQEALDRALLIRPDIVLTDIRMPVMGGLELIRLLREKLPKTRCLILSGYQEFEYAKEAIRLGAFDYLLKPIEENELVSVVEKTVEACLAASRERDNLASLNKKLNESSSFIRNKLLGSIASGEAGDYDGIKGTLERYGVGNLPQRYLCIIMDLEMIGEKFGFTPDDSELVRFAAANITDEIIGNLSSGHVFYLADSQIAALIGVKQGADCGVLPMLQEIHAHVQDFIKTPVIIGAGNIHEGFGEIAAGFREAKSALKYRFMTEKGRVLLYGDVIMEGRKAFNIPVKVEKTLVNGILCGDTEGIPRIVDSLFAEFAANKAGFEGIFNECLEILMIVKHSINAADDVLERISDLGEIFAGTAKNNTADELKARFTSMLKAAASEVSRSNYSGTRVLISQIKEYIGRNYSSQITLNTISEKFYINSSYISRVFKKESSENFIDYLTRIRIDEAKNLLAGTDLRVYEISERIGYNNSKYFSQLFEKTVGISPRKYRETYDPGKKN